MKLRINTSETFAQRHIGPNSNDVQAMLQAIGADSIDSLVNKTVPENIRLKRPLNISAPLSEYNYLKHLRNLASKNKVFR
ncbi:MAG TPA: hypothetical protein PLT99_02685, partial [Chitinophagales bacterium]|nr:hypothetical protein [Chitinophagales bacterium]